MEDKIITKIKSLILAENAPDIEMYRDLYYLAKEKAEEDKDNIKALIWLSDRINSNISRKKGNIKQQYYLHYDVLKTLSPVDFESYMLFMEWNRDIEKQFYRPRKKSLKIVVDSLQELDDGDLDLLGVSMPPASGKALADDTPILTRKGWKNHGDLEVGDEVIGMNGEFKKVIAVHPKCMLDRLVTFSNGEQIQCHKRHEWRFYDRAKGKEHLEETQEWEKRTLETGVPNKRGHRYILQLPHRAHIKGENKQLPLDPYTLGAWLGDGANKNPRIANANNDRCIIDRIVANGYPVRWSTTHRTTGVMYYDFDIRKELQSMGMCHSRKKTTKHIPEEYLTASTEQRLQLLAGLIDTDGYKNRNSLVFTTVEETLKNDVIALVSTFGWRCSVWENEPCVSSSGIIGKQKYYAVHFTPDIPVPCAVVRKRNKGVSQRRIAITNIETVEPKQGNCITVEGDGMYLAGKTMLPTHNTTLALFYLTWLAGKYPNKPCLTGSHSNSFVRGCYDECLRIMSPHGEYQWNEVFPSMQIVRTNANDCQIDVDTAKRFASLQFTSIGSGNAGKYRAERLLYADDLVSGSEVALSKERLDKLWGIYTTDLRQRMQGDCCKQLVIATRWSVHDVLGRLEQEYAGSDKARFIVIPALDENGESNFDYPFNLGFTTAMYNEQKAIMDDIMWRALFMNQPIEREGLIFAENELRRYFELPKGEDGKVIEPDAIISVCDTKDKGEDFCVMPVAYVYGDDYYIEDCVCDNGMPSVVDAKLVDILLRHKVAMSRFESNSAGRRTAEEIQRQVKQLKGNTHITTKYTTANKITKIITESKWILDHCLFKENTCFDRNSDYGKFMNMLTSFTQIGKNRHDDVPDAMAQLSQFARSMCQSEVRIIDRPF